MAGNLGVFSAFPEDFFVTAKAQIDILGSRTRIREKQTMRSVVTRAGYAVAFSLCSCLAGGLWPAFPAKAQTRYIVTPVAEMKVKALPKGPLYWRVEHFPTLQQAKAAAPSYRWNPDTVSYDGLPSLTAEVAGKAWLFTLGPPGGATAGGTKVAEIGPVPPVSAPEYLLRVNYGHGPPGAKTPVHSHPGSESFYVISGRLGQRTPHGVVNVEAGHSMKGHEAGMTMEVFNSGNTELDALIMFVVDATKPFSVPAKFECPLGYSKLGEICVHDHSGDIVLPADQKNQNASR